MEARKEKEEENDKVFGVLWRSAKVQRKTGQICFGEDKPDSMRKAAQ